MTIRRNGIPIGTATTGPTATTSGVFLSFLAVAAGADDAAVYSVDNGAADRLVGQTGQERTEGAATPTPTPCMILHNQANNQASTATNSQNYEPGNDTLDDQAADDFVVPEGETWTIQQVFAGGNYDSGTGVDIYMNVFFYSDSGTLPGPAVGSFLNVVPIDAPAGVFTINLPSGGQVLGPGTYWVSVQANMDFTVGGQWFWRNRLVQSELGCSLAESRWWIFMGWTTWGKKRGKLRD